MFLENLIRKKNKRNVAVLLKCTGCGSFEIYEADLFRKSHLKEYLRKGHVTQYCGYCADRKGVDNPPHKIHGLHTEMISRVKDQAGILHDLQKKRWG